MAALALAGCNQPQEAIPPGALVVTQTPRTVDDRSGRVDRLDLRYAPGSRIVLVPRPEQPAATVLLSSGLVSAGEPALDPDGRHVLFTGKAGTNGPWQIYRASLDGGRPVRLTDAPGGAMGPACLPAGRFVFSSPVPPIPHVPGGTPPWPALFSQAITGGPPERLTFGRTPASDATVLGDGRILFVSAVPPDGDGAPPATSLFTVNNDGTEISAFAAQHDAPALLRRPRETPDGRVLFLAAGPGGTGIEGRVEQVLTARPFRSRSVTWPSLAGSHRSAEPLADGAVLATWLDPGAAEGRGSFGVYRFERGRTSPGPPVFDDPDWQDVEALPVGTVHPPMGRLSNVDRSRNDGLLLCLDARLTDHPAGAAAKTAPARVRFLRHDAGAPAEILGEAPVHEDGSFLVTIPADATLGLELLDPQGGSLGRCPPAFWLRPGENRACVGCHEPHNRAPDNVRPRAVAFPPASLRIEPGSLSQTPSLP